MGNEPKTTFNSVWDAIEATPEQAESMKIQSQLMIRIEQLAATNDELSNCVAVLEAKLAAIDDLMVRRIKHHQEMKDLGGSGMARKREHYKLHVLSETLGEIRKVTKARATLAAIKETPHD